MATGVTLAEITPTIKLNAPTAPSQISRTVSSLRAANASVDPSHLARAG